MSLLSRILPFLLLLLTFISVNQWSEYPIGNTATTMGLSVVLILAFWQRKSYNRLDFGQRDYRWVYFFLIWALLGTVRGLVVAENYWEYKNLATSSLITFLPLSVYAFYDPGLVRDVFCRWRVWAILAFLFFFYWVIGVSQFYLGPIYFLACFLPLIPSKKWKFIVGGLLLLLIVDNVIDNRAQTIKGVVSLLVLSGVFLRKHITDRLIKFFYWVFCLFPWVLLYLGIMGQYNVFAATSDTYGGKYVAQYEGQQTESIDLTADTRTFIYQEVISSALNNDYLWLGRTQARGNDSFWFASLAEDMRAVRNGDNIKNERSMNELCFPNIFTWLGIVGMFLYIMIYLHASFLAIYRSNSFFVKLCGLVTAFNFAFGWVENATAFDILNITYWVFIAIGLSPKFREMRDADFIIWYQSIYHQ